MSLNRIAAIARGLITPNVSRSSRLPAPPLGSALRRTNGNTGNNPPSTADKKDENAACPINGMASEQGFYQFMEVHTRHNPGVAQGQKPGPLEVLAEISKCSKNSG